ncbi:MAG TPA: hypothetical protein DEH78_27315 [Solibacterales bacterium]|nr:hypothetical protein [Bryobacterales bacterium]
MIVATAALSLGILGPAGGTAGDLPQKAELLISEAKKVQLEAQDISKELRVRQFDLNKVKEMMTSLTAHVEAVNKMVAELQPMEQSMTGQQQAKFNLIKTKAELLTIFATNKQGMLLGDQPEKSRSVLRAKAEGIAKRSEMLQKSAMALRQ